MSERQGPGHGLSEHELSEIRMLIEERTGICFDESRERFFSTRVREHLRAKGLERGTDLLRCVRKSNVEYEALLEGLSSMTLRPGGRRRPAWTLRGRFPVPIRRERAPQGRPPPRPGAPDRGAAPSLPRKCGRDTRR